jgi:hypothetical protein
VLRIAASGHKRTVRLDDDMERKSSMVDYRSIVRRRSWGAISLMRASPGACERLENGVGGSFGSSVSECEHRHSPWNVSKAVAQQLRFARAIRRLNENLQDSNRPIRQALSEDESLVLRKAVYALQYPLCPVIPPDQHDRRVDLLLAVDTQIRKTTRAPAAKATVAKVEG